MKRHFAAASLLVLASCGSGNLAATFSTVALSAEQIAKLQFGCRLVAPALAVAVEPTMPAQVRDTAIDAKAYCDQMLAGVVPSTTDANTPAWFDKVLSGVSIAAKAAGIILPLVL